MIATTLSSARVDLEPINEGHASEMFDVLDDESLHAFTGGEPLRREELERRFTRLAMGSGDPGEHWLNWILRPRSSGFAASDGVAVGYLQATVIGSNAEVAWVVGTQHQGRGFAADGAALVVQWLAEQGVAQVTAHIHPDHSASNRVAERAGLVATGDVDEDGEVVWARSILR